MAKVFSDNSKLAKLGLVPTVWVSLFLTCLPSAETHRQAGVYTAVGGPNRAVPKKTTRER